MAATPEKEVVMNTRKPPFEHLFVIELASVLAGPTVGQFFAELGARVLKVENPVGGDVTRTWKLASEESTTDVGCYFSAANWGKQTCSLDLKNNTDRNEFLKQVATCDVLVENFKMGDAKKLKVDFETLSKINPRLIYASITGYGESDARAGYDAVVQAESGFMNMNGLKEGAPTKLPVALMDLLAAHQLKEAILIALLQREKTGLGQKVTTSLFQSAVASLANQATNFLMGGIVPTRMGSEHPNIAPYGKTYRCIDGNEVLLAVGSDLQFQKLCTVLGCEDLAVHSDFKNNRERVKNRETLNTQLQEKISKWRRDDLLKKCREEHIPAGAVNTLKEVFDEPAAQNLILENVTSQGIKTRAVRTIAFQSSVFEAKKELSSPPHFMEKTK